MNEQTLKEVFKIPGSDEEDTLGSLLRPVELAVGKGNYLRAANRWLEGYEAMPNKVPFRKDEAIFLRAGVNLLDNLVLFETDTKKAEGLAKEILGFVWQSAGQMLDEVADFEEAGKLTILDVHVEGRAQALAQDIVRFEHQPYAKAFLPEQNAEETQPEADILATIDNLPLDDEGHFMAFTAQEADKLLETLAFDEDMDEDMDFN